MRFGRLDLLRYGHFTDRSFGFPASEVDFHVVFGLNEAGKSTALSAIEDLLFGIPVRTPYNFLHDYGSLRIGAVLENEQALLQVVRRKGRKDTLLGTDQLPLPGGETALRPFLAGADRPFFERMFSLDHVRLETGGREILEAKDDVGQVLFSAGAGLTGLRDLLGELSHEADGLWAPRRARRRKFYQALDRLRDAGTELRQRTVTAHKWHELKQAFERAEEAYAGIESEFENLSAEVRRLSRIRRVYREVCRMVDLEEEKDIAALEKVVLLPEDARRVLEESERRDSELTTRIETLSGRLAQAREELSTLEYDERLILRDPDITHLHERRIEVRRGKDDLPKRQAELAAAEVELRDLAAELGWKEEVGKLISRIPARTKLGVLRSLLSRRGKLASDRENRDENVQEAQAEHEEIRQTIEVMGETFDVSRLRSVIRAIRESGDITGRVRRAELEVKHTAGSPGSTALRLAPGCPESGSRQGDARAPGGHRAGASGQAAELGAAHPRGGPPTCPHQKGTSSSSQKIPERHARGTDRLLGDPPGGQRRSGRSLEIGQEKAHRQSAGDRRGGGALRARAR